ncbi:MAG: hypothetical protein RIF32_09165, partial [Leptospirales bacterium]
MQTTNHQHTDWLLANEAFLRQHLDRLRLLMEKRARLEAASSEEADDASNAPAAEGPGSVATSTEADPRFPLHGLCSEFGLSLFERDVILMCAGMELDSNFAAACVEAGATGGRVSFALALEALEDSHWSALLPDGALRRWRLIEVVERDLLVRQPLRIPERVLHFLLGFPAEDALFAAISESIPAPDPKTLSASRSAIRDQIVGVWNPEAESAAVPMAVQLYGEVAADKRTVAAAAAARCGLHLRSLAPQAIPNAIDEQENLARLWEREAVLGNVALYLELPPSAERGMIQVALDFIRRLSVPRVLAAADVIPGAQMLRIEVAKPDPAEQRALWRECLGEDAAALNGRLEA